MPAVFMCPPLPPVCCHSASPHTVEQLNKQRSVLWICPGVSSGPPVQISGLWTLGESSTDTPHEMPQQCWSNPSVSQCCCEHFQYKALWLCWWMTGAGRNDGHKLIEMQKLRPICFYQITINQWTNPSENLAAVNLFWLSVLMRKGDQMRWMFLIWEDHRCYSVSTAQHTLMVLCISLVHVKLYSKGVRWLSGLGIGLLIRRLPVRFLAVKNDIVSLGKAFHPTYFGGYVPVLTVSHSG